MVGARGTMADDAAVRVPDFEYPVFGKARVLLAGVGELVGVFLPRLQIPPRPMKIFGQAINLYLALRCAASVEP
jgi:hypothetical protein